jgi:hypothetical protein
MQGCTDIGINRWNRQASMPVFAVLVFHNYCNRKDNCQPTRRITTELKHTFLLLAASSANFTNVVTSSITCCIEEGKKPSHIQEKSQHLSLSHLFPCKPGNDKNNTLMS